ncbi:DUF6114 domain-containing protein [Streptomyces sp. NPDC047985]|uniref:DUF6114 domain-containing protein n=1 Tax=unclassified Streptomyces TaxID=2593676 RepID=UPI00343AAE0D
MSPESTGHNEHFLRVFRREFRTWRGNRPFWAGLFTMVGGVPIMYFPYANMHLGNVTLTMSTTAGAGSLIIGVLLVTLGLTMWFHHIVRVFAGVATILLALVSIPVANVGGFVVGFLFALLGGALSVSWAPGQPEPEVLDTGIRDREFEDAGTGIREPGPDLRKAAVVPQRKPDQDDEATVEADGGRHRAG